MFSPGMEFLLLRKLEKSTVAAESARVLHGGSSDCGRFPGRNDKPASPGRANDSSSVPVRRAGVKSRGIDPAEKSPANSVLAERTPLEQELLRPYYVLDESPEEIGFACKCVRSMSHKQSPAREPNIGGKRRESSGLGTILYCTGSGPSVPRQHCACLAFTIVKNTGGIREKGRLAFIGFT